MNSIPARGPSLFALLLALASATLVVIVGVACFAMTSLWLVEISYRNLKGNLLQVDFSSAKSTITRLQYAERSAHFVDRIFKEALGSPLKSHDRELSSQLSEALKDSNQLLFDAAQYAVEKRWSEVVVALEQSLPPIEQIYSIESEVWHKQTESQLNADSRIRSILNDVDSAVVARDETSKMMLQIDSAKTKLETLRTNYGLIRSELADLLTLPLPAAAEQPENKQLEFYGAGVLEGLVKLNPELEGVPDLVSLRIALEKIGGRVELQGAGSGELFSQRLEQIRQASTLIAADVALNQRLLEDSQRERASSDLRYRLAQSKIVSGISLLILDLNRPDAFEFVAALTNG